MSIVEILILVLISGICGGIAESIVGYSRTGCIGSIVFGFIGALLGVWIARSMELPVLISIDIGGEVTFPIIWSIIGATVFVAILSLFTRRN
jgi:uncharacterized membrane protein YeaQ/YmgE (transglycosylase-associated protein family)